MDDYGDITAGLPAPRDDEPRDLRQDIADELADHLHSSLARERLRDEGPGRQPDAVEWQAALERFGDPAAVARRLWWDAMKEKIMAQRVLSVTALLAAATSLLCAFFMWRMVVVNHSIQEALLASQREMTNAMLAELRGSREGDAAVGVDPNRDWQPLRVKLVDTADQPIAGSATCTGKSFEKGIEIHQQATTDPQGFADFGTLPAGQYEIVPHVKATAEFGQAQKVLLGPGRAAEMTIFCPAHLPESLPARFAITPPAGLKDRPLYYLAYLSPRGRQVGDQFWYLDGPPPSRPILLDKHGAVLGELPRDSIERRVPLDIASGDLGASGVSGYYIEFADTIPTALEIDASPHFLLGKYEFTLTPYFADTTAKEEQGIRPALRKLTAAVLVQSFTLSAGDEGVCRIGPCETAFWQPLETQLTGKEPVNIERANAPAAPPFKFPSSGTIEPGQGILYQVPPPTPPTATAPGSSAPD